MCKKEREHNDGCEHGKVSAFDIAVFSVAFFVVSAVEAGLPAAAVLFSIGVILAVSFIGDVAIRVINYKRKYGKEAKG